MNRIIEEDVAQIISSFKHWEHFRNKTVLVSGANGFLPAYLVETFLGLDPAMNTTVIALVRNQEKALARFSNYTGNVRHFC